LLAWWTHLFQVPAVAINTADKDACQQAVEAGADFVMPPETMWDSPEMAARIARWLTELGKRSDQ
jgi:thiamine monophosphate synthase